MTVMCTCWRCTFRAEGWIDSLDLNKRLIIQKYFKSLFPGSSFTHFLGKMLSVTEDTLLCSSVVYGRWKCVAGSFILIALLSISTFWVLSVLLNDAVNCCGYSAMVILERMSVGDRSNGNEMRNSKRSEINLLQCHFVHSKSHIDLPGIKHWSPLWETGDPIRLQLAWAEWVQWEMKYLMMT
jgi:hypothetical protein